MVNLIREFQFRLHHQDKDSGKRINVQMRTLITHHIDMMPTHVGGAVYKW